jgi:cytidylate kinase
MSSGSTVSTIAIDGPAASGKSTLGQRMAQRLGYLYFDTGVMYRAVTLAALERNVPPEDEKAVSDIARVVDIVVRLPTVEDQRQYDVLMDGEDVTWDIRSAEVDANVSLVSSYPVVREEMTRIQRQIGLKGNVVMVGRDIGTVVMPEADLIIFLVASLEERAKRRTEECLHRGEKVKYVDILRMMRERDQFDSTRDLAPLIPAADAVVLDTTDMSEDEVLDKGMLMVAQRESQKKDEGR